MMPRPELFEFGSDVAPTHYRIAALCGQCANASGKLGQAIEIERLRAAIELDLLRHKFGEPLALCLRDVAITIVGGVETFAIVQIRQAKEVTQQDQKFIHPFLQAENAQLGLEIMNACANRVRSRAF